MLSISKLIALKDLHAHRERVRATGKRLVLTNGCFDLLHAGHVYALQNAAQQGDVLWVGVNSDTSIRQLKGPTRPIYDEQSRLYLLNALYFVDGLFVFNGTHLAQEMQAIQPDIYVKSGDYNLDKMNPLERSVLEACHAKILFLPFLDGWSTTHTIERITKGYKPTL